MSGEQLDLFAVYAASGGAGRRGDAPATPAALGDDGLIAAIAAVGMTELPALATEAGRRRLAAAIPTLERLCRRFAGFGVAQAIPEQVTAIEALGIIGGRAAAEAVARLIVKAVVQGPTLPVAVAAAARLRCVLPIPLVQALMRHADPECRADACRCSRPSPEVIPLLVELLDDLNPAVAIAAACALGRMGRIEGRPRLLRLLRENPSPEVIEAVAGIADHEAMVLLGRIMRTAPDLAAAAGDALDAVDDPHAARILAAASPTRAAGRRSG